MEIIIHLSIICHLSISIHPFIPPPFLNGMLTMFQTLFQIQWEQNIPSLRLCGSYFLVQETDKQIQIDK